MNATKDLIKFAAQLEERIPDTVRSPQVPIALNPEYRPGNKVRYENFIVRLKRLSELFPVAIVSMENALFESDPKGPPPPSHTFLKSVEFLEDYLKQAI